MFLNLKLEIENFGFLQLDLNDEESKPCVELLTKTSNNHPESRLNQLISNHNSTFQVCICSLKICFSVSIFRNLESLFFYRLNGNQ